MTSVLNGPMTDSASALPYGPRAPDRGLDPGIGQAFRVLDRKVLHAAISRLPRCEKVGRDGTVTVSDTSAAAK
jgi:hypothetical protein